MDPEYECQMNESESSTSDLNSIVDTDNSEVGINQQNCSISIKHHRTPIWFKFFSRARIYFLEVVGWGKKYWMTIYLDKEHLVKICSLFHVRYGFWKEILAIWLCFQLASAERMKRAYKRNYKTYSYEQLVAAYLYVKEKKVAVKFAARAFGVPPSTLNDRVQGKVFIDTSIVMNNPKGRKILPQPQFNKNKVNT